MFVLFISISISAIAFIFCFLYKYTCSSWTKSGSISCNINKNYKETYLNWKMISMSWKPCISLGQNNTGTCSKGFRTIQQRSYLWSIKGRMCRWSAVKDCSRSAHSPARLARNIIKLKRNRRKCSKQVCIGWEEDRQMKAEQSKIRKQRGEHMRS